MKKSLEKYFGALPKLTETNLLMYQSKRKMKNLDKY